jgi:hypothetical protein
VVGLFLRVGIFIPTTATDSYITVTSPVVSNWNCEGNRYLKNRDKSDSRVIDLQNRQTDDSSESRPTIIFTFTNPITLCGVELLFIFYDSIPSLRNTIHLVTIPATAEKHIIAGENNSDRGMTV